MKIIFLDIDGVINNAKFFDQMAISGRKKWHFDPELVALVSRLSKETEAKFVISSSWKLFYSLEELSSALKFHGLVDGEVIGKTPDFSGLKNRGYEIKKWLKEYAQDNSIYSFVILDDRDDMSPFKSRLVLTKMDSGFTEENLELAQKVLKEELSKREMDLIGGKK